MNDERKIVAGIVAHVDAGKTTLSEALLFLSGKINTLGRVDRRSSYLDTDALERERGITIFAKQAVTRLPHAELTLLDTPGHVDFSAETERCLAVLDCALLVISASDGVQAHTETLWRLLERYNVPTVVFVTKTDLPWRGKAALMEELTARFGDGCQDFSDPGEALMERLALLSERAMEKYLDRGTLEDGDIRALIRERRVFPCLFGSGLKTDGVAELLDCLDRYAPSGEALPDFGARVYKIARDAQGGRMTLMRLTGGALSVRDVLKYEDGEGRPVEEKVTQLRVYSGAKYTAVDSVRAGQVCAALGLSATRPGQGLGAEADAAAAALEPVLSYRIKFPAGCDVAGMLPKLRQLAEEDPQLHIAYDGRAKSCCVQLMGRVQGEIFKSLVRDRLDVAVELDAGQILYKETIAKKVEGVGHFEPLRHYAEVHLILEPLPRGGGIELRSSVSEDELDRNWQRLILTHLAEKQHLGVLTGSPLTDVRITLAAGRAHVKHTEGGDFREATYRAVRQGLMGAESVLLEPYFDFCLTVPAEQIGRAISDVRAMNGVFDAPESDGELARLTGSAPAAAMNGYMEQLVSYTRGRGSLTLTPGDHRPCRDWRRVVQDMGYDAQADVENTGDSVFCAHGGGFNVRWDRVPEYMHLESCLKRVPMLQPPAVHRCLDIDERELEAIMLREFGPIRRPEYREAVINAAPAPTAAEPRRDYIIVDGYNLIFSWDELKTLARDNLDLARSRLEDILSSYCGFTRAELVLVFDAYRTPGSGGSRTQYHNIHVAYTAAGETGDAYIERLVNEIGKNYSVRVVTSDNLIRLSALRSGVLRISSAEFARQLEGTLRQIDEIVKKSNDNSHKTRLSDGRQ